VQGIYRIPEQFQVVKILEQERTEFPRLVEVVEIIRVKLEHWNVRSLPKNPPIAQNPCQLNAVNSFTIRMKSILHITVASRSNIHTDSDCSNIPNIMMRYKLK
jgi:hypothetical protein